MNALAGRCIVITRPREQAQLLVQWIESAGAEAVLFPALEICDPAQPEKIAAVVGALDRYDLVIFISPTAVERAFRLVPGLLPWPKGLAAAVVGPGGAAALAELGVPNVIVPKERYDSEGLLARLAVTSHRRALIFRGEGGRELLAETLRKRGVEVTLAECYRRARPASDAAPLVALWRDGRLDAIVVTSSEAVDHLAALLGDEARALIAATPVFAPHPRIVERAQWYGARRATLTAAGDAGLMEGMQTFFAKVDAARH